MKAALTTAFLACFVMVGAAQDSASRTSAPEQTQYKESKLLPNPVFDKLKTLAGEWEGTYGGKQPASASFKIMGGGSSLLQILPGDKPGDEMVSVFHPDKTDLLLTHYCSAKNTPRMKLQPSSDPNTLRFTFLDITNQTSLDDGYMQEVAIIFKGEDRHTEEWTWIQDGKRETGTFEFTRKK